MEITVMQESTAKKRPPQETDPNSVGAEQVCFLLGEYSTL